MNQTSPILSEQIYGSSKKLQLIKDTMSIQSLLVTNGDHDNNAKKTTNTTTTTTTLIASPKRRWPVNNNTTTNDEDNNKNNDNNELTANDIERAPKMRKTTSVQPGQRGPPPIPYGQPMTTLTCLHAAVAQKSYGSEKRFLCPPPVVSVAHPRLPESHISMAIISENGERPLEQRTLLDEHLSGSFKYLHVTGTAKAKQFSLRVSLSSSHHHQPQPYATFVSNPISIISKPSKKTAKARNVSTCILANAPVSLFNRINSQTVRTKYLTSDGKRLCAKNATWSAFDIILVRPPYAPCPMPVTYGAEIILRDTSTGIQSPPVILRKVDKGRITQAFGPVSQMQKVALQLASSVGQQQPLYLCANSAQESETVSTSPTTSSSSSPLSWIEFLPSRIVQPDNKVELAYEEVDDSLFWTIVGIHKFEYSFYDPLSTSLSSISPFPVVSSAQYNPTSHTLDLFGQHLVHHQASLLDCWLGPHGPLPAKLVNSQAEQPGSARQSTHITIDLPTTQDLLQYHYKDQVPRQQHLAMMTRAEDGVQHLELPLLLVRQDTHVVYHSGKALTLHSDPRRCSVMITNWSVSK
ncbi:transcription factor [Lichtheimia corymbifera JMRC:FSU:9682]|uniref:Transcription factor n=1 Tax=Lichtheimia corymbifera JMRC:FSU:9682 TaxID=1263082 RepID=A0A068RJS2_9FUNG|nr:transcription factor [Lichtheimia corymbifera JMRC:FSU:9682]